MKYLILTLLLVSCAGNPTQAIQKQKERSSVSKHDKTQKKNPEPLKKAYGPFYLMFLGMFGIGVIMLVLGIKGGLNKDLIVSGGIFMIVGILGPVLIYLALLALKVILWSVGIAIGVSLAYLVFNLAQQRNSLMWGSPQETESKGK